MPTSQNPSNRGNNRQYARGNSEGLRRTARLTQVIPEEAKKENQEERSPLLLLARRIREEQGREGLSAFLRAMEPFAAPYELKNIASMFGMEHHYEGVSNASDRSFSANTEKNTYGANSVGSGGVSARANQNGSNADGARHGFGAPQNQGADVGFDPNLINMMRMMSGMNGMGTMGNMNAGNTAGMGNMGGLGSMMQMMQLMRMLPMMHNMGKGGQGV